jgi:predicted small secreted protein
MKEKIIKLTIGIFSAVLLLTFILSGCSAVRSSAEAIGGAADNYSEGQVMDKTVSEAPSMQEAGGAAAETTAASAVSNSGSELYTEAGSADSAAIQVISTKLIKNASIQIEVEKGTFEKIFFQVASLADQNNGYVSNSQSYSDSEGNMTSGQITIRVDKANFDVVLNKVKAMGKVLNVNITVSDVTQEYVDNESRLKNLDSQRTSLLKLMDKSVTVKDSIEIQRELSNVEGQIEIIKGRQNYLDNLIGYSTIDIAIAEPQAITESNEGGFIGAVRRGATGALTVLRVIATALIAISPLLVLAGIVLIIIWQSLRSRNRKRKKLQAMEAQKAQQNK